VEGGIGVRRASCEGRGEEAPVAVLGHIEMVPV
jgi:hypothetical protein